MSRILLAARDVYKKIQKEASADAIDKSGMIVISTKQRHQVVWLDGLPPGELWVVDIRETLKVPEDISPETILRLL